MAKQEFYMSAEKIKTIPDGRDKYALLGYFREMQSQQQQALQNATAEATASSEQNGGAARSSETGSRWRTVPAIGSLSRQLTIANWLLALIALILFVQLVRK